MPRLVVTDAGAVVELLLRSPAGTQLAERIEGHQLLAPLVIDGEVLAGLRRVDLSGRLSEQRAAKALTALRMLPVSRVFVGPLLARAWEWRHRLGAHDALYVALAEAFECPLATADRRLARAVEGEVEVWPV